MKDFQKYIIANRQTYHDPRYTDNNINNKCVIEYCENEAENFYSYCQVHSECSYCGERVNCECKVCLSCDLENQDCECLFPQFKKINN